MNAAGAIAVNITDVERAAFAEWPAETVEELDGWQLRAMSGVTRRANSVWTAAAHGALGLEERLARVEAFYVARGLSPRLQVSEASQPEGLDTFLARRGYELEAPVSVRVATPSLVARTPALPVTLLDTPSADWLEVAVRQGRYRDVQGVYVGLLERLGTRATFAVARSGGRPAAAGLGIAEGRAFGVCSMLTLSDFRGRGLATAILQALASQAQDRGAEYLFLQVEADNGAASRLYESHGFRELYRSHYRVAPLTRL